MSGLIVNHSNEPVIIPNGKPAVFLAGPSLREPGVTEWREEAIRILRKADFEGIVYVPEFYESQKDFDYTKQIWWERRALHLATAIIFWVPRNLKTLPGFTTNHEHGYWLCNAIDKVIYGRPKKSENNRYLDLTYYMESGKNPHDNLKTLVKEVINIANERKGMVTMDTYGLNKLKGMLEKVPELGMIVGETEFTPEAYATVSTGKTYGEALFPELDADRLLEFNRTALSILLYYYIKDGAYEVFTGAQSGAAKLTKETFDELRQFFQPFITDPEKERLLLYYVAVNDLGKSEKAIQFLKDRGVETVDHDERLFAMLECDLLPTLNSFGKDYKTNMFNVLRHGIDVGQFIQGGIVDCALKSISKLNDFERTLMMAEAILDIGGVTGHLDNQNGTMTLTQPTVENLLLVGKLMQYWYMSKGSYNSDYLFNEFLAEKASDMGLKEAFPDDSLARRAATRICLAARLSKQEDIEAVIRSLVRNRSNWFGLIDELNRGGYSNSAMLFYYLPALLNNAIKQFNGSICDALEACLPFVQDIAEKIRRDKRDLPKDGMITVMLREPSLVVAEDPTLLRADRFTIASSNPRELEVKLKAR